MSQRSVDPYDRPLDFSDELVHVLLGLSASLDELAGDLGQTNVDVPVCPPNLTGLDEPGDPLEMHVPHSAPGSTAGDRAASAPVSSEAADDDALLVDALLGLLSLRRTLHVWLAPILHGDVEPTLHDGVEPIVHGDVEPILSADVEPVAKRDAEPLPHDGRNDVTPEHTRPARVGGWLR